MLWAAVNHLLSREAVGLPEEGCGELQVGGRLVGLLVMHVVPEEGFGGLSLHSRTARVHWSLFLRGDHDLGRSPGKYMNKIYSPLHI